MGVRHYFTVAILVVLISIDLQGQITSWKQSDFPAPVSQVTTILYQNESIYVGTKSSGLFISSDSGRSFSKITPGLTSLNKLSATSNGNLFAVGGSGLARSGSNGYDWGFYNNKPGIFYNFMNSSLGTLGNIVLTGGYIYMDNSAKIYRSTDDGDSWNETYSIPGNQDQISYNVITLAIGKNGTVLGCLRHGVLQNTHFPSTVYDYKYIRSTDYGVTWSNINTNFQITPEIFDYAWNSKNEVFAVSNQGVLQSKDNGVTWFYAPGPLPTINVKCIVINSYDDIYIGTGDAGIFVSTDDGNSWQTMNQGLTDSVVSAISIGQDGYLYAGTGHGRVYKSTDTVVSKTIPTKVLPHQYILHQNYPNPFNPTTIIDYQIPRSGLVKLKVYNILGKEVATLVNQEMQAGSYEIKFDGNKLSSGVYFYRFQSGNFTSVKKMILLK